MKCAVVVPQWSVEQVFLAAFARSMGSYQEPSGPLYIAAALQQAGHTVVLKDGALYDNAEITRLVAREQPGFIGLSVVAPVWPSAVQLIAALREAAPAAVIGVGGPWPAAAPDRCLAEAPGLDIVFTSEGEHSSVEVVAALEGDGTRPPPRPPLRGGVDLSGIPGLAYRGEDGAIVNTGYRPPIEDLDRLPFPARDLLGRDIRRCSLPPGGYRATPVTHIIGSRGCTNRCIYCFHLEREQHIRYRSADNIVDEVELCVHRYGFREVRFLDDNFTGDRERVFRICDELERRRIRIPWYVSSRVDTVDPEMLRRMKRAGCWAMLYGAESGVEAHLRTIGKGQHLDEVRQAVAWTRAAGIEMFLPFMFGIPGETFEDGLKTIDFAIELDPYYANFNCITPFPGTWLWEHGDELGTMSRDPAGLSFQGASFIPHSMTEDELVRLRRIAFRRFYSRPGFALRWLRGASNPAVLSAMSRGTLSFATMWLKPDAFRMRRG